MTDTQITTPTVSEDAIRQVAMETIKTTMERHGITDPERLKPEVIERAYEHAREKLTAEAERQADPNYQQRVALEEKIRLLEMQNDALRSGQHAKNATASSKTLDPFTVERKLGPAVWNHQLDSNGRLQAIGVDPSVNTPAFRQEILDTFGKGSSVRAAELARTDHARYEFLKHAGKALRII
jgi:hypothetical protein